jgi:hypothetical protein
MAIYPNLEPVLVLLLTISTIAAQFYFPPKTRSRWRTRLRWLLYTVAIVLTALITSRLYELY